MINDTDVGFSGWDEFPFCEAVGDGSRGMRLTNLISGYISSYFSTVLPVTMVAVILAPAIVPMDFYVATPFFLIDGTNDPLQHNS